jgi:hypothetical protein
MCGIGLERLVGSAWAEVTPKTRILCAAIEHVIAPGGHLDGIVQLDPSLTSGTYRARVGVDILENNAAASVESNAFIVTR